MANKHMKVWKMIPENQFPGNKRSLRQGNSSNMELTRVSSNSHRTTRISRVVGPSRFDGNVIRQS
jgi:hypothetical protein